MTPARVGIDFHLAGPDKTPLDQKGLKESLGADAVIDEPRAMQQRVAAAVYGIEDEHRYDDLLHLQRTLRNPDVGVKAVSGQLEEYLSRALPPLDPDIVTRLAAQFQDLEVIRENIRRLRLAAKALSQFLAVYAGYAAGVLRAHADSLIQAEDALAEHLAAAASRAKALADERTTCEKARQLVAEQERQEQVLGAQVKELEDNEEYRDLSARREIVTALSDSANSALLNAANCRDAENNATTAALSALMGVRRAAEATARAVQDAREQFRRARLDPWLLPAPPPAPVSEPERRTDPVQVDIDPDAMPRPVERVAPPVVDLDALAGVAHQLVGQCNRAAHAATQHRALASTLEHQARQLDDEHQQIATLKAYAEEAAAAAEQVAAEHRVAAQEATTASGEWLGQLRDWTRTVPHSTAELGEPPALPNGDELVADRDRAGQLRTLHQEWASPALVRAQQVVTAAGAKLEALEEERDQFFEDLDACRNGLHTPPPPSRYASADRSERRGAPFYELVDFHPALSAQHRAGLEASIQASGLLDAWVAADGGITDPDLHDLLAVATTAPLGAMPSRSLASVLVSVPGGDCVVTADSVTRLLASVSIADNPAAAQADGLIVSLTGRYRAGSVAGAWAKNTPEHIGADAREAYRLRRIAELLALVDELDARIETQRQVLASAEADLIAWERHIRILADTAPVIAAHVAVISAKERHRDAKRQAQAKMEAHARANGLWEARRSDLSRQAAEANLPDEAAALTECLTQISSAIDGIRQVSATLNEQYLVAIQDAAAPVAAHAAAVRTRERAEANAITSHGKYAQTAKAVALLVETLGTDGREYDARLSSLRSKLQRTSDDLPGLRTKRNQASDTIVRLQALQEADEPNEREKRDLLERAEVRFDAAVRAVGVWASATGDDEDPPIDRDAALQAAASWRSEVEESDLINAIQKLRGSLPDGHDASVGRDGGVLTVMVSDGEGSRPIVTAAARVANRLAEHKGHLDTRYREIFEEFLLRDLAEHLRRQIDAADDLCTRMNDILAGAQSSQGVHVQLSWDPSPALDDATRQALALVRRSFTTRTPEQDAELRRALQERIEAERDVSDAHYGEVMARALDYRTWYAFTVRVRDTGPDGQPRNRLLRRLSSGETRLISYVVLFAAAAAFYDALTSPGTSPLRLVLLDEAFERLDDPTITRLLELLADLDMDWVVTWPGSSAFSSRIDRMQVYDIFRPKAASGMAFVHTTWTGNELRRNS
jgi:uncharacterized protein (TIGR02680 family)